MKNLFNLFYVPSFLKDIDSLSFDVIEKKEQQLIKEASNADAYNLILNDFYKMKEHGIEKVVCFSPFIKALIKAVVDSKMQATVCLWIENFDCLNDFIDLEEFYLKAKNSFKGINFALYIPHVFNDDSVFEDVLYISNKYNLPIFIETSKTLDEVGKCVKLNNKTPVCLLNDLGFINENTTLLHCNYLEEEDEYIIAQKGACVAVSPLYSANMGLGQANIVSLLKLGVKVGVCTYKSDCFDLNQQAMFTSTYQKLNLKEASSINKVMTDSLVKRI